MSAFSLERWFTCSPCISYYAQLWVSSSIPSVSAGHCGLSLTQRRLREMNNATGRLFLKASHKASAFSGILLEHSGAVQQRTKGGSGEGGDGGWDWHREGERGRASSGIHPLQGRGNVLWSKGRNVKAVMWVNGSYFRGARWKRRRWALTLGRGRRSGESRGSGWQLRHTNALSVFGLRHGGSLDARCLPDTKNRRFCKELQKR